jgi:hypothetical protein
MFDGLKMKSPRNRANGSGGYILAEAARMLLDRGLHYTASAEKMEGRNDLRKMPAPKRKAVRSVRKKASPALSLQFVRLDVL